MHSPSHYTLSYWSQFQTSAGTVCQHLMQYVYPSPAFMALLNLNLCTGDTNNFTFRSTDQEQSTSFNMKFKASSVVQVSSFDISMAVTTNLAWEGLRSGIFTIRPCIHHDSIGDESESIISA